MYTKRIQSKGVPQVFDTIIHSQDLVINYEAHKTLCESLEIPTQNERVWAMVPDRNKRSHILYWGLRKFIPNVEAEAIVADLLRGV